MKILTYAWFIYDSRLEKYKRNHNGAGIVVRDLCEALGRKEESYLFLGQSLLPGMKLGNISIIKTDYRTDIKNDRGNNSEYIEYMTELFKKAVDEIKPDVIHFHDAGDLAYSCIENVCIKMGLGYSMTYHLYIGKNPIFAGYEDSGDVEERMIGLKNLNLVAVSLGEKNKILNDYPDFPEERITPILNGTSFKPVHIESSYKDDLKVGNRKILLCAGTISYRKNQIQILKIFKNNDFLKDNVFVIFCGGKSKAYLENFQQQIQDLDLEGCMRYIGVVDSEEMKKLYSISDGLVMPSFSEGLSISALEAMSYGLPVIMFRESECALDLNDDGVVSFAENYSDEELEKSIYNWYNKKWDKDYILKYSEYFSMERMADDYLRFFRSIIDN